MLRMNKRSAKRSTVATVLLLSGALFSCRATNSNLSDDDPFATTDEDIEELKEDSRPEYKADWQIEFYTRTHIVTANQPVQVKDESLLVTKDDTESQKAMASFVKPIDPELAAVGECRTKLLDNLNNSLLPPVADVVDNEPKAKPEIVNGKAPEMAAQPDPKVEEVSRDAMEETQTTSIHYRLMIRLPDVLVRKYPNGFTETGYHPSTERFVRKNCGIVDMQLRWVFLNDKKELPSTPDGTDWWDGGMPISAVSARRPTLSIPSFVRAFTASKQIATRRLAMEAEAENSPLIDNLR